MQIAICDDDTLDRNIIRELLYRYFKTKPVTCRITEYESGSNLLYEIEDGGHFDLVILDIYMNDLLGIDVARRLRQLQYQGEIIFLTTAPEYAIDSYDVAAAGYLLKPHSYQRLSAAMDRVLRHFDADVYHVRSRSAIICVPYDEILYVESSNTKCILHRTCGACYTIYKRLGDVARELNDDRFLRCHQSYLVNMQHVCAVDNDFELTSGAVVPIRQRGRREIRQAYCAYIEPKAHRAAEAPSAR